MEQTTAQTHSGVGRAFRLALPATLPVFTGYFCLGVAYGILMWEAGYGPVWTGLMSAIVMAGSMQYATISLLVSPFHPLAAFLLAIMVNARHMFYGLSLLDRYRDLGALRFPCVYLLTDEVYSLVSTAELPPDVQPKWYYFFVSILNWAYWLSFSLIGNVLGGFITFDTTGMDFALTALFVVLFLDVWKKKENRPAGAIGILCSVACLAVFGGSNMVIASMVAILVVLIGGRKRLCT